MPVVTVYRHGVTMGVAPMTNNHPRAKRDIVVGWSPGAARRNLQFLYSIDERELTGEGFAFTLTVRNCPPTPHDWHYAVNQYFKALIRLFNIDGKELLRYHYVTEWQRRGVPHLHGCLYVSEGTSKRFDMDNILKGIWRGYCSQFGVSPNAQYILAINGAVGWFQYLSKHAARGIRHYQRSAGSIPEFWRTGTGRMWGKGGEWKLKEPIRWDVSSRGYHVLRRWARSWRKADARSELERAISRLPRNPQNVVSAKRRIKSARGAIRCSDRELSKVRGISDWIPDNMIQQMLKRLEQDGYRIERREC